MAALLNVLLFSVLCSLAFASSGAFDRVLDNVDKCHKACDNTYAAHTYENGDDTESCKRGCRFYSIMAFVHEHDTNATVTDCTVSCQEAYNGSMGEQNACLTGCQSQHQAVQEREVDAKEEAKPSVHMLYPLMYMHGVYSNMLDKVYRHMEVSWSFFMQADNGQLVVLRSKPHVINFVSDRRTDFPDGKTSSLETNMVSRDNSATPLLSMRASQIKSAHSTDQGLHLDVDDAGRSDWLTCVARKTGIARIFLCFLILATAIVMIWFCLTAAATAPEQHLSINGDLEYLRTLGEKDCYKLLHPQARVEARPLPVKITVEQI